MGLSSQIIQSRELTTLNIPASSIDSIVHCKSSRKHKINRIRCFAGQQTFKQTLTCVGVCCRHYTLYTKLFSVCVCVTDMTSHDNWKWCPLIGFSRSQTPTHMGVCSHKYTVIPEVHEPPGNTCAQANTHKNGHLYTEDSYSSTHLRK